MSDLIPFNVWSFERIRDENKFTTARHKKYSKDPLVYHITPKLEWWIIKAFFWKTEGAHNPDELQKAVELIYRRPVPDDEKFHLHFFDNKKMHERLR